MTDPAATPASAPRPRRAKTWRKQIPDEVIAHGREGLSRAEIAAEMGYALATFDDWERRLAVFRVALAQAHGLALAWWERQGRLGVRDGKLNATLWSKNMAGRFPELYGERAAVAPRKAEAAEAPRRQITDLDRAKVLAMLMHKHPEAFEVLRNPAAAAVAAPGKSCDGDPSRG